MAAFVPQALILKHCAAVVSHTARTPQTIRAAIEEVLDNPSYAAGARVLQADIAAMPSANEVLTRVVALAR